MLSQAYKWVVMMGRIPRERVLSNGLMIRRGYTFELCMDEIIIYGNFQKFGQKKKAGHIVQPWSFQKL